MILEQGFKDRLQKDYRSFYKSEKIYKDLQVPWKRGLILLGVSTPFQCSHNFLIALEYPQILARESELSS